MMGGLRKHLTHHTQTIFWCKGKRVTRGKKIEEKQKPGGVGGGFRSSLVFP